MASLSVLSTLCLCVAIIAFLYPQYSSAEDHITDGYAEIGKNQRFYRSVSTNVKLQPSLIIQRISDFNCLVGDIGQECADGESGR